MKFVPERDGGKRELILLAPPDSCIPNSMERLTVDPARYQKLLDAMQKMRGRLYHEDGALCDDQLTPDGRHVVAADEKAWHILSVDRQGEILGCARYMAYANSVPYCGLGLVDSDLAKSPEWGRHLQSAVELEIRRARQRNIAYVEVGGWAVSPKLGNSFEALRIALGSYSLARILGGCLGIGTVTQRNMSSSILRRLGGRSLIVNGVELPAYYDSGYGCQMEILQFESAQPNPRYEVWIRDLQEHFLTVEVISRTSSLTNLASALQNADDRVPSTWQGAYALIHAT
jgi:hypothetical protein